MRNPIVYTLPFLPFSHKPNRDTMKRRTSEGMGMYSMFRDRRRKSGAAEMEKRQ